jgi:septal ring factor EnvC (AmiA/AmiB activator)
MHISRHFKRLTLASTSVAAMLGGVVIATSSADLSSQINASQQAAASLQSQISSETAQIEKTAGGVAAAQARLSTVQSELSQHITELHGVDDRLMSAGQQLDRLEKKLHLASRYLGANLRASYESDTPNIVDVILNAHGFSSLLEQVNYMKDAARRNAEILHITRIVRARVQREALSLGKLEHRDQLLTNQILQQRNQAATIEAALAKQQLDEETARSHVRAHLASVNAHTQQLQTQYAAAQAAAARAARAAAAAQAAAQAQTTQQATEQAAAQATEQVNQQASGYAINTSGAVTAPPGAPAAVQEMIAAGNRIATLPYIWGGGHGSFVSAGYDCSGSVSYVLNAAGLLSSPEVSGDFESYGDPGAGQWVTIYANAGHVWMQIGAWRFDTVSLSENGSRWSSGGGEYSGFVVRHPIGY